MNLKQLDREQAAIVRTSHIGPETWKEAIGAYLAGKKMDLVADLSAKPAFNADDLRRDIRALDRLAALIGERVPSSSERLRRPDTNARHVDFMAHLSRVLTPDGWREAWGYKFQKLEADCLAIFMGEPAPFETPPEAPPAPVKAKRGRPRKQTLPLTSEPSTPTMSADDALATMKAVQMFLRFLDNVERQGVAAQKLVHQERARSLLHASRPPRRHVA